MRILADPPVCPHHTRAVHFFVPAQIPFAQGGVIGSGTGHALNSYLFTPGTKKYNIIPGYDMENRPREYALEFLLAFDGRIHHLDEGYWIKFEIKRVATTRERPHGLSYSFTLHAPDGARLVGFDNAHGVLVMGSRFKRRPQASDHWHRTANDPGRPYAFKDADTLLQDFFREVRRVLADRGIPETVVKVEEERR